LAGYVLMPGTSQRADAGGVLSFGVQFDPAGFAGGSLAGKALQPPPGAVAGSTPTSGADATPDPFSFTDRNNLALSTVYNSNVIRVSGINAPAPISVSGPPGARYMINGVFTSAPGLVKNLDLVQVQAPTAATVSTSVSVRLTIGGVSTTWTATTSADGLYHKTSL
jgi:hypothetical protein